MTKAEVGSSIEAGAVVQCVRLAHDLSTDLKLIQTVMNSQFAELLDLYSAAAKLYAGEFSAIVKGLVDLWTPASESDDRDGTYHVVFEAYFAVEHLCFEGPLWLVMSK